MTTNQERTPRVALYARISEDATGDAVGVTQQLGDAQALADARGWQITGKYSDNDISALNGAPRPGYRQLMASAATGAIDKIIVFHTSRLWRNRVERAEGIKALSEQRVSIAAVKGPELDLASAYGRGLAGLIGEFDTLESEVKGERVKASAARRAREGRASGGVAYGWTRHRVDGPERFHDVIDPYASAVVQLIVSRLLAGHPLLAVTRELRDSGEPTPSAYLEARRYEAQDWCRWPRAGRIEEQWEATTVKKLALRPSNAGLRVHHKGRPTQEFFDAAWEPIVSKADYEALTGLFKPGAVRGRRGDRQHLLTGGIAYCAICGDAMRTVLRGKPGKKVRLYVCEKGCIGRNQAKVDDLTARIVQARLCSPDVADLLAPPAPNDGPRRERLAELRLRLDEAADSYGAGLITIRQLETITGRLRPELDALDGQAPTPAVAFPAGMGAEIIEAGTPERIAELWEAWTVSQRRALLEVLGLRVTINPDRGGPGFRPDAIGIDWRE